MKRIILTLTLFIITSTLLMAGSISGAVTGGDPGHQMQVVVFEPGNPQNHHQAPVEDGAYTVAELAMGTYLVKLSAYGMHLFYDGALTPDEATPVEVSDVTPDVTGIDFTVGTVPAGGVIAGFIQGPMGPINYTVELFDQLPVAPAIQPVMITDGSMHHYHFEDVPFGTYYVKCTIDNEDPQYYDQQSDPANAAAVVIDETMPIAMEIDFVFGTTPQGNGEISGVVSNNAGEALENVMLHLMPVEGNPWFDGTALSGADGSYAISEIPAGDYYLGAFADDMTLYEPWFFDGVSHPDEATIITIEENTTLTIDPVLQQLVVYSVTGMVLDAEGQPIEDAMIIAFSDAGNPGGGQGGGNPGGGMGMMHAVTAADGSFELLIPEGDYIFAAHVGNCMQQQVQYYDHKESIDEADVVTVNAAVTGINFDMDAVVSFTSAVEGVVSDAAGEPVAEAMVQLFPVDQQQWFVGHAVTADDGSYVIDEIPAGDYYLAAHAQGYEPYFFDGVTNWEDATVITIAEDETVVINPVLSEFVLYTISGIVLDHQGNPVMDAMVFAHPAGCNPGNGGPGNGGNGNGGMFMAQPQTDGTYVLDVPAGDYIVGAEALGGMNAPIQFWDHQPNPANADIITVDGDVTGINFDFGTNGGGSANSISGSIMLNNAPAAGAIVVAIAVDQMHSATVFTNDLGEYELADLNEAEYYIFAFTMGSVPTFYPGVVNFMDAETVMAAGMVVDVDFDLVPINGGGYMMVDGYVRDTNSQPLANSTVVFYNADNEVISMAQTNNQGYYAATGLPEGSVAGIATKMFYNSDNTTVSLTGNTSADFTLEPLGPTSADETPAVHAVLTAMNYPNPFNPVTTISFNLPASSKVTARIYNTRGQMVKELMNETAEAGAHQLIWNGTDADNNAVASGIYYYKVAAAGTQVINKMVLMK
jgi:protocatechuate 3,4-dioxygenase beta subunit